MNPSEHLTKTQITAFSAGSLAASESRSIGGHLIRCVECRGLLPLPDPKKFWAVVVREEGSQIPQADDESSYSIPPYIQAVREFFDKPSGLAWSGGVLVVIVGLALVVLFSASNEPSVESEVAKSFEIESPISIPRRDEAKEPNVVLPDHANGTNREDQPPDRVYTDQRSPRRRVKETSKSSSDNRVAAARLVSDGVSRTRGVISKCGTESTLGMDLEYVEPDLVLRWQPVPNAAKYHLYISDDEEILIDEFESTDATFYRLRKPLDLGKMYRWKVIITLESGETITADLQKFTATTNQSSSRSLTSRQKTITRCAERP